MLFISVRSATVENVPKVLRVVEDIKRFRHKAGTSLSCVLAVRCSECCVGMDEEGELYQYVIYEQAKPKGPKIIKLDDPKGRNAEMESYTPPTSLTVHLSKIDMPELKPRATGNASPDKKGKGKEKEKKEKEKEKPAKKDKRKEGDKKPKPSPSPPPPIPHHSRPPANTWAQYPSQLDQESGALNSATPPQPPQPTSMVSNLKGRFDLFAKR